MSLASRWPQFFHSSRQFPDIKNTEAKGVHTRINTLLKINRNKFWCDRTTYGTGHFMKMGIKR
jgi:hypothetical protein